MLVQETILNKQEKKWLLDRHVARLSDNKEVQIYPMGAERYLSSVLLNYKRNRYDVVGAIAGKHVLVIPGHGNSGFLFAKAGAKSVTVYDKDPVTIAWIKAFKKYYHYQEVINAKSYASVGTLLDALNYWYPPLIEIPSGRYLNPLLWFISPNSLRRAYLDYMTKLVRKAILANDKENFELNANIVFHVGTIKNIIQNEQKPCFDTAYVPYLLGVRNGIENPEEIIYFIEKLIALIPKGQILVTPSRSTKEFYLLGKRYFETTAYDNLKQLSGFPLCFQEEDTNWFRTQGLLILKKKNNKVIFTR